MNLVLAQLLIMMGLLLILLLIGMVVLLKRKKARTNGKSCVIDKIKEAQAKPTPFIPIEATKLPTDTNDKTEKGVDIMSLIKNYFSNEKKVKKCEHKFEAHGHPFVMNNKVYNGEKCKKCGMLQFVRVPSNKVRQMLEEESGN